MATYIVLTSFTDQGVRNAKDTTKAVRRRKATGKTIRCYRQEFYWTLGSYDVVGYSTHPTMHP